MHKGSEERVCREWDREGGVGNIIQFVDVWVEYTVDKTDAGGLVGILVGKLDVDFPEAAGEGG